MAIDSAKRAPGFPPGVSGNPGGRPSIGKALAAHGLDQRGTLADVVGVALLMLQSKNYKERIFAVQWFGDRMLGKALATVKIAPSGALTAAELAEMSDEDLRAMIAEADETDDADDADADANTGDGGAG